MYKNTKWLDKIVDADTGETLQTGTRQSAANFNNAEGGISDVTAAAQIMFVMLRNGVDTQATNDAIASITQAIAEHTAQLQLLDSKNTGVCDTAADDPYKTIDISPYVLDIGDTVTVNFTYANTTPAALLNVSDTGAKPIFYKGQPMPGELLSGVQMFSYDGTNWNVIGDFDTNTDTTYDVMSVAEALEGAEIIPRTMNALNLSQTITDIATGIVEAELADSYDIYGLQSQVNDLIFQLAAQGVLDGSGFDTVVTIDSASDVTLVSGIYADGKVYI